MTFLGFVVLEDPPKANIFETIKSLKNLGVSLKIITGDNHLIAVTLSQEMGLNHENIITGPDLHQIGDDALLKHVAETDVFAEIDRIKERIMSLRKEGWQCSRLYGLTVSMMPLHCTLQM